MLVLSLSMARIDLNTLARRWFDIRYFSRLIGLVMLMLPLTALALLTFAKLASFNETDQLILLVYALAAPIGSAAGMCFMLGWDARRALEATLLATFLMPFIGSNMISFFAPGIIELEMWDILIRLAWIVGGATLLALCIRAGLGSERIDRNAYAFDGVTSVALLAFLFPVFDGIGLRLREDPMAGLRMLGFVCLLNFGASILTILATTRSLGRGTAGALGIMWGNRNVGIYLAALPAEPTLALFVALYQFPMYFTPLVLSAIFGTKAPTV